jgi:hypothetical protein
MEPKVVDEIERRRAAFMANPIYYLNRHRELKSLISKDLLTFPQSK